MLKKTTEQMFRRTLYFSWIEGHSTPSDPGFVVVIFLTFPGSFSIHFKDLVCALQGWERKGIMERRTEAKNVLQKRGFNLDAGVCAMI